MSLFDQRGGGELDKKKMLIDLGTSFKICRWYVYVRGNVKVHTFTKRAIWDCGAGS